MKPNYEKLSSDELRNLLRKDLFDGSLSNEESDLITGILSSRRTVPLDAYKSWLSFLKRFYPEKYETFTAKGASDSPNATCKERK